MRIKIERTPKPVRGLFKSASKQAPTTLSIKFVRTK